MMETFTKSFFSTLTISSLLPFIWTTRITTTNIYISNFTPPIYLFYQNFVYDNSLYCNNLTWDLIHITKHIYHFCLYWSHLIVLKHTLSCRDNSLPVGWPWLDPELYSHQGFLRICWILSWVSRNLKFSLKFSNGKMDNPFKISNGAFFGSD